MTTYYHYTTKKFVKDLDATYDDGEKIHKPWIRTHDSPLGHGVYFTSEGPDGKWEEMLPKMYGEEGRGRDMPNKKCVMFYAFKKKELKGIKRKQKGIFSVTEDVKLDECEWELGCADEYSG